MRSSLLGKNAYEFCVELLEQNEVERHTAFECVGVTESS